MVSAVYEILTSVIWICLLWLFLKSENLTSELNVVTLLDFWRKRKAYAIGLIQMSRTLEYYYIDRLSTKRQKSFSHSLSFVQTAEKAKTSICPFSGNSEPHFLPLVNFQSLLPTDNIDQIAPFAQSGKSIKSRVFFKSHKFRSNHALRKSSNIEHSESRGRGGRSLPSAKTRKSRNLHRQLPSIPRAHPT